VLCYDLNRVRKKGVLVQRTRVEPGPGQESVWDYPRPPRLERCRKRIRITFNRVEIVDTTRAWRVLETSHPPVYYIPRGEIREGCLRENRRTSYCEWKGAARYLDVRVGDRSAEASAWYYPEPNADFEPVRDHVAFYPDAMDRCSVDGEVVRPQPGGFYGGWITSDIVGPSKGDPGTEHW
jgi:uncharacterized protein (DUF427 family)